MYGLWMFSLFQIPFSLCLLPTCVPFEEASNLSLWFFDAKDTQWLSFSLFEILIFFFFLHLGMTLVPQEHLTLIYCGDSLMVT